MNSITPPLVIRLLGRFEVYDDTQKLAGLDNLRVRELFCYLLLNRNHSHSRDRIASDLWGGQCTTKSARKYLRDSLWRLKSFFSSAHLQEDENILEVESSWVRMNSSAKLHLDTEMLEDAFRLIKQRPRADLNEDEASALEQAVDHYRGDLLENWQNDWCIYDRERYVQLYLHLLDYLMEYNELRNEYESGLEYGRRVLKVDPARECTHRQLMRLYARAGYRTEAIRQYFKCETLLKEELGVRPSASTIALFQQINTNFQDFFSETDAFPRAELPYHLVRDMQSIESDLARLSRRIEGIRKQVFNLIRESTNQK